MKIAATGHRPNKLADSYDTMHPINVEMGRKMREFILIMAGWNPETKTFRDDEVYTIISGMAQGVDTIWALVTLKLKRQFPGKFKLECAIPCRNQEKKWSKKSQKRYHEILEQADKVTLVTDSEYTNTCMQVRNEYMVDNCDYLYCVWDGTPGGTKNCIDYAKGKGTLMYIQDPTPWIEEYLKNQKIAQ